MFRRISWITRFKHISQGVLNFLLPPHCLISGDIVDQQGMIAPRYWAQIHFIEEPFCECCGLPFPHKTEGKLLCTGCVYDHPLYQTCRSAVVYNDESKALILGLKYGDRIEIAPLLATWLNTIGGEILQKGDMLIPVPLHPFRRLKRKFNQAAVIARHLSKKSNLPTKDGLLKRARHTPSQSGDKKARRKNVRQAFYIRDKNLHHIRGKNIVLIDDVYTTGSTVNECAKALLDSGAKSVDVLTVARVVYRY